MSESRHISHQGFSLKGNNELDLAFLSLRIALKAYFSTYNAIGVRFDPNDSELDKRSEKNISYCEAYAETVVHFQHFFELIIKDILRSDHLLLASRINSHPTILYKILHKKQLSDEEQQKLQSIEFSDALTTLCELIKSKQIKSFKILEFILDHRPALKELNTLRNKVWHRGRCFLPYTKLDHFIGKCILPIVNIITELRRYKHRSVLWKYKHTECGIDPVKSIYLEYQKNQPASIGKVALLKEIGRAAYNNPLFDKKVVVQNRNKRIRKIEKQIVELEQRGKDIPGRLIISKGMNKLIDRMVTEIDTPYIERAKRIAKNEADDTFLTINKCPICSVESLLLYDVSESVQDSETGRDINYCWVDTAKCECCTFEIGSNLEIEHYDVPIANYWTVKEL